MVKTDVSYILSSVIFQDMEISVHELRTILNRVVTRREFIINKS